MVFAWPHSNAPARRTQLPRNLALNLVLRKWNEFPRTRIRHASPRRPVDRDVLSRWPKIHRSGSDRKFHMRTRSLHPGAGVQDDIVESDAEPVLVIEAVQSDRAAALDADVAQHDVLIHRNFVLVCAAKRI